MNRLSPVLILITAMLVTGGCGAVMAEMNGNNSISDAPGMKSPGNTTLNATTLQADTLVVGDTTEVSLSENPTTGYQWIATVTDGLEIVNDTYSTVARDKKMMGTGGKRVWTIKAVKEGDQTFSAVYRRSWEPVTGDGKTYHTSFLVLAEDEQSG